MYFRLHTRARDDMGAICNLKSDPSFGYLLRLYNANHSQVRNLRSTALIQEQQKKKKKKKKQVAGWMRNYEYLPKLLQVVPSIYPSWAAWHHSAFLEKQCHSIHTESFLKLQAFNSKDLWCNLCFSNRFIPFDITFEVPSVSTSPLVPFAKNPPSFGRIC